MKDKGFKIILKGGGAAVEHAEEDCDPKVEIHARSEYGWVTEISDGAFHNQTVATVEIPDSVTRIGDEAFADCASLTAVKIKNHGLRFIGSKAFRGCVNLKEIEIPETVESIGVDAFDGCTALEKVYVYSVDAWCEIEFKNEKANPLCNDGVDIYKVGEKSPKTVISISKNVRAVTDYAFANCGSLQSLKMTKPGCLHIGNRAFVGCKNLEDVNISETVESIAEDAFDGCTNLKKVYVHSLDAWCGIEFKNEKANPLCNDGSLYLDTKDTPESDVRISGGMRYVKNFAFASCQSVKSIKIESDDSWGIGRGAFCGCKYLEEISLPQSAGTIREDAFDGCTGLKKIYVYSMDAWCGIEFKNKNSNPLCNGGELYLDGEGNPKADISIPCNVRFVGSFAFANCKFVERVEISEGDAECILGQSAFEGCKNLAELSISKRVIEIGESAFENCESLKDLKLSANALCEVIGANSFKGCVSLENIVIPQNTNTMGEGAFSDCTHLKCIKYNAKNVKALSENNKTFYKAGADSKKGIILTTGPKVERIPEYFFCPCVDTEADGYPRIRKADFSKTKRDFEIGGHAFENCKSLKEVLFQTGMFRKKADESRHTIGDYAFNGCALEKATVVGGKFDNSGLESINSGNESLIKCLKNGKTV